MADIMYIRTATSFRFLSSSGTIFHTLDAKYRREFKLEMSGINRPYRKIS